MNLLPQSFRHYLVVGFSPPADLAAERCYTADLDVAIAAAETMAHAYGAADVFSYNADTDTLGKLLASHAFGGWTV